MFWTIRHEQAVCQKQINDNEELNWRKSFAFEICREQRFESLIFRLILLLVKAS